MKTLIIYNPYGRPVAIQDITTWTQTEIEDMIHIQGRLFDRLSSSRLTPFPPYGGRL